MNACHLSILLLMLFSAPGGWGDARSAKSRIQEHSAGIERTDSRDSGAIGVSARDSLNVRLVGRFPTGPSYGIALDEARELAFVGSYRRVSILDVSDPSDPVLLSEVPMTGSWGVEDLAYRDNKLYVADFDGTPDVSVVSVDDPRDPVVVGDLSTRGFAQCITLADTFAVVGYDLMGGSGKIQTLSISDPSDLTILGELDEIPSGTPWQIVVRDSFAYVAAETGGLKVISIADPSTIYEVGFHYTPGMAESVALDDTLAYVADVYHVQVFSVADPTSPVEVAEHFTSGLPAGITIRGSVAYVADGPAGISVLSIADPSSIRDVGYYRIEGWSNAIAVIEPYAFVANDQQGLLVFEYLDPASIGDGEGESTRTPQSFSLSQNYPNPFNPSTTIAFTVPAGEPQQVRLTVYDLRGRMVRRLVEEAKSEGNHTVHWDGRDQQGRMLGSGTYLYELRAGRVTSTRRLVILR